MAAIQLISPKDRRFSNRQIILKDGIELEKGVQITTGFLEKNEQLLTKLWQTYSVYVDLYLDLITPVDSTFKLYPYQRIFLRACMRYTEVYFVACRAASKSFLTILAKVMQCIFIPGFTTSIIAPGKAQAAQISQQKIGEIFKIWPLLEKEVKKYNHGSDYTYLEFKNGSKLSVGAQLDSDRGKRIHSVMLDEARDLDGQMINSVVLPQLNVPRRMNNGTINNYEKTNTQRIWATSAGSKSSFAYEALLDTFMKAIINPKHAFVMGISYRIPVMHGLIAKTIVEDLKLNASYDENTFAQEYMGLWQSSNEESWFSFDKLNRHRKIKNPEWTRKYEDGISQTYSNMTKVYYLISVDVARGIHGDQSVACVFRINIRDGKHYATLVNIFVLGKTAESKVFERQAVDIKKLIEIYRPKEVVMDINGVGWGLGDLMTTVQVYGGVTYPAYGFFNNEEYKKTQPKDVPMIMYGIKANGPLNSKIHANAYTRVENGLVNFLISEQDARSSLLATKEGQRMTAEEKIERLMPHELTSKLFDEICNLRLKRTGIDLAVEQINARFPKDKYSAFAYGLWRIKEIEEESTKFKNKFNGKIRQLVFYSSAGGL